MIFTILLRILMLGALLGLWYASQNLIAKQGLPEGEIGDKIHEWMAPIHAQLQNNPSLSRLLLITSSLGIDLLALSVFYMGIFGESFRPIVGMFLILILRQSAQLLTALPAPHGMIWEDPGVPSLFVTYHVSNDLFFSGHTAMAVYGCLVLASLGNPWLTLAAVLLGIYEVFTVLALRAHWTMDVYGGLLAAGLCFMLVR